MNNAFVPLAAPAPTSTRSEPFRPRILNGAAAQSVPFNPAAPAPASAAQPAHPTGKCPEPQITLTRDGDKITSIRIQCSCGTVTDLQCVYS
jgi:hypothetical protein